MPSNALEAAKNTFSRHSGSFQTDENRAENSRLHIETLCAYISVNVYVFCLPPGGYDAHDDV